MMSHINRVSLLKAEGQALKIDEQRSLKYEERLKSMVG